MKVSWTRLKSIISANPRRDDLFLTLIDEEGTIFSANANMLKSFEIGHPRSVKTNFFKLVHPMHASSFKKTIKQVKENQDSASVELYLKNGHYHPMKWVVNYLPQSSESGRVYFCFGYKILDDERSVKFNKLVEKHYQLIMDGPAGIIFHDKRGELIATNQQTASIFSTTLERLYQLADISERWRSKWKINDEHGEPVPFEKSPFMKALETGKAQKETLCIRFENEGCCWIQFYSQPLPDDHADGDCCWAVSTIIDITNEKILASQVEEKKALINAFVKQTPNLAWVVNEDGILILGSDAFYQYFGLDKIDTQGKEIAGVVPPVIYKALYEKHIKVLETGNAVSTTEQIRLADGANYISHINIFPYPGKEISGRICCKHGRYRQN
jgi:PAS domain S-box-containing protein